MSSYEELRVWLHAVRLVHHVHGRVRLKLAAGPELPDVLPQRMPVDGVRAALQRVRGIRALRINPLARSCIVEYDPQLIPMQAWPDYLAGADSAEARILDAVLRAAYREVADAELR